MGKIFISYSHKDKAYVRNLRKALQAEGFDVWIDDRIDYGTTWQQVIQEHLDECDAFIIVMTENAYESKWVHNEVTRAERKKKPFFILLLSGDTWLSFEAIQYEDVTGGKLPSKKFYESLARVISQEETNISLSSRIASTTEKRLIFTEGITKFVPMFGVAGLLIVISIVLLGGSWMARQPFRFSPTEAVVPTQDLAASVTSTTSPTLTSLLTETIETDKDIGMELVPAGEFIMGASPEMQAKMLKLCQKCDSGSITDQSPQRSIYLDAFWIDKTEVTNAQFQKFVDANGYITSAEKKGYSIIYDSSTKKYQELPDVNWRRPEGILIKPDQFADYPVTQVSWDDAQAYCNWDRKRLPTEAEWEKAARWEDGRFFPWGNMTPDNTYLNFNLAENGPVAVMSYPAGVSKYGVYDMVGNVWEWVNDWYAPIYNESETMNPKGPVLGQGHLLRGGSWASESRNELVYVMTTFRFYNKTNFTSPLIGFRCAKDASP